MRDFAELRSDTSKLVLLYVEQVGDASLTEITDRLDLSLLTVSTTVQHLAERGLVRRLEDSERVVLADDGVFDPHAGTPDRS
ncbi:MAG: MarR family transcriptional regulator [Haloferacaceae archaeon]